jgi:hypothetical protein
MVGSRKGQTSLIDRITTPRRVEEPLGTEHRVSQLGILD